VESEQLLAQALRAQVAGAASPAAVPVRTEALRPAGRPVRQLGAGWVLLIALLLGLLGGAIAGIVSLL
jgi:hypothetical protein